MSWRWSSSQSVGFGQLFSSCASHLHWGAGQRVRAKPKAACWLRCAAGSGISHLHAGFCFSFLSLGECIVLMCLVPALLVHFSTLHLYFRITRILLKACFSFCSREAEDRVSEEKCMVNSPSLLSLRALCKYNFHMTLSERYCSCFRADTEVAGRPREGRLYNTDV